jgi:hypothetical protein
VKLDSICVFLRGFVCPSGLDDEEINYIIVENCATARADRNITWCEYLKHVNLAATPINTLFQAKTVFSFAINFTSFLSVLQVSPSVKIENRWCH